jgi:hypothetical protein
VEEGCLGSWFGGPGGNIVGAFEDKCDVRREMGREPRLGEVGRHESRNATGRSRMNVVIMTVTRVSPARL